jgi:hypothetical protein
MVIQASSPRALLTAGIAAPAGILLLMGYCQVWSGEQGVPLHVSFVWSLVTLASWLAFGAAIWSARGWLAARIDQARLPQMAEAVGLVFAIALGVLLASTLLSKALWGDRLLLDYVARRLVTLSPLLLLVALFVTAGTAALRWRGRTVERRAQSKLQEATDGAAWIELPEAPLLRVRRDDVAVIRTARNYCELDVAGRTILVRATAKSMEERLAPLGFARVHRTAIVNLARVRVVSPGRSGRLSLTLDDGTRLDVSRAYSRSLATQTRGERRDLN